MAHILVKITPDGNGMSDKEEIVAISELHGKLQNYCKTKYGKPADGEFSWDSYFIIKSSVINIV